MSKFLHDTDDDAAAAAYEDDDAKANTLPRVFCEKAELKIKMNYVSYFLR